MRTRLFASSAARRTTVRRLGLCCLLLFIGAVSVRRYASFIFDPAWIRATVVGLGPYAAPGFIIVQTAQVVFAPIPGQTLGIVGGYLFGTVAGTAYSMLGVVIGSTVVFCLARRYGRPFVERVIAADVLDRFDSFAAEHGVIGLFAVFLLPTFPDDAICALAGITTLRYRTFIALVAVGRLPTFALVALVGDEFAAGQTTTALAILSVIALLSVSIYAARERFTAVGS
ncbi:hypothetical protein C499_09759 [Halogeometricum borinquense DSM 11551]|uniref:Uncharacterized conserved protein n=2 Tax=Halogeometricum borinquense TaxID=60847 RepID=E4NML1_HALBP|nr:TVP38/TMEM64 family protein [Halogeometricum borinquense]ADQ66166.1 uncharacterized conserved protein [Halogeometricum borinquense DSM 11551]ELY27339.1 hypothetical protein C499_09759 [Halogeometricum borinquense DSM 11551]RYJ14797.1 TVP38/TMEM64 family protein [Halogeometricum borinquense]